MNQKTNQKEVKKLLAEEILLLEREAELREGLPHKWGYKHYVWSRRFFESRNRMNFLCAANQIGKSSTNIRKCIEWATNKGLWPELWHMNPNQFWYLYPTKDVATAEFKTKWQEFLPKGKFKEDPVFGWKANFVKGYIHSLEFNSGLVVYFKTYAQDVQDLQTGTCFAIFCDEEAPVALLPELLARLNATDGYFHLVFTATLGQEYFRCVMEEKGDYELHKDAFKTTVSLYDCMVYEDGTPSHWSEDKIKRAIAKCGTKAEIDRRIFGKFVKSSGRLIESFDRDRNLAPKHPLPISWLIYSGVDIGSGGEENHPAAIVFVAVSPDFRQGRVFRGWRGDGIQTSAGDIYIKYKELRAGLKPTLQSYDWESKEFEQITNNRGDSFVPAIKDREFGIGILNILFKHSMLKVQGPDPELDKLVVELSNTLSTTPKTKAKDDFLDALRYAIAVIPWDFSFIDQMQPEEIERTQTRQAIEASSPKSSEEIRREYWAQGDRTSVDSIEEELDAWSDLFE